MFVPPSPVPAYRVIGRACFRAGAVLDDAREVISTKKATPRSNVRAAKRDFQPLRASTTRGRMRSRQALSTRGCGAVYVGIQWARHCLERCAGDVALEV